MPQPLSSLKRKVPIRLGGLDAADERPELALLAAKVIAVAAELEANMGELLAAMLGNKARPAVQMFHALSSTNAQTAALEAAAEAALPGHELSLFRIIMGMVKRAAKRRNMIAHWNWAYSPELPDALLFSDPRASATTFVELGERWEKHQQGEPIEPWEADQSHVFIYKEADFREIIAAQAQAGELVALFTLMVLPNGMMAREKLYNALVTREPIAAALRKLERSTS